MADATVSAVRPRTAVLGFREPAVALGVGVAVGAIAVAEGGYFAPTWAWAALAFLWVVVGVLISGAPVRIGGLGTALLAALVALGAWTWISTAWSADKPGSVLEGQRALVYVSAAAALLLLVRRHSVPLVLGGLLAAITLACGYGLATRLFPGRLGVYDEIAAYRLSEPLGYWNGLGAFAAVGALLALAFAARARRLVSRSLAAASMVVLLLVIYFTFSRGAWIALAIGLVAWIALDERRLQVLVTTLVVVPPAAVCIWLASRSDALTRESAALEAAAHDGKRLAPIVVALALLAGVAVAALGVAERRITPGRIPRLLFGGAAALVAVVAVATVLVRYGGPVRLVERSYDAFKAPPGGVNTDFNARLFTFSGQYRVELWESAWDGYREHPVLGLGAGSYERHWVQNRPLAHIVRDAHSLYLETLAELGPLGLAFLLVALGVPLLAAVRARGHPLAGGAFAAYVVYLAHAAVDWDWEMPALTLAALTCAIGLVALARDDDRARSASEPLRNAALVVAILLVGAAFVGLVGSSALAASEDAVDAGKPKRAETEARKADRWAPWSSEPAERLGDAQLAQKKFGKARASFLTAIGKEPDDWNLWLGLAAASEGAERLWAFERAARLNPYGPEVEEFSRDVAADLRAATEG